MSFTTVSPVEAGGSWLEVDPEYVPNLLSFPPVSPVDKGGSWLEFDHPRPPSSGWSVGMIQW